MNKTKQIIPNPDIEYIFYRNGASNDIEIKKILDNEFNQIIN